MKFACRLEVAHIKGGGWEGSSSFTLSKGLGKNERYLSTSKEGSGKDSIFIWRFPTLTGLYGSKTSPVPVPASGVTCKLYIKAAVLSTCHLKNRCLDTLSYKSLGEQGSTDLQASYDIVEHAGSSSMAAE